MRTLLNAVVGVVALVVLLESIQSAPVVKRSSESEDRGKVSFKAFKASVFKSSHNQNLKPRLEFLLKNTERQTMPSQSPS